MEEDTEEAGQKDGDERESLLQVLRHNQVGWVIKILDSCPLACRKHSLLLVYLCMYVCMYVLLYFLDNSS